MIKTKSMKRIHSITLKRIADKDPDSSYLGQEGWEDRLKEFQEGLFCFVGVIAEAEVSLRTDDNGHCIVHEVSSGGLWGIESDSEGSYFDKVEEEQLGELKKELRAMGFGTRAISKAVRDVERKE